MTMQLQEWKKAKARRRRDEPNLHHLASLRETEVGKEEAGQGIADEEEAFRDRRVQFSEEADSGEVETITIGKYLGN
jgi:hypothetical protein